MNIGKNTPIVLIVIIGMHILKNAMPLIREEQAKGEQENVLAMSRMSGNMKGVRPMTDNEIIKALECCASEDLMTLNCGHCPNQQSNCMHILYKSSLDLINRQKVEIEELTKDGETIALALIKAKAEIESLNKEVKYWEAETKEARADIVQSNAEAIKEFAERLCEKEECFITDDGFEEYFVNSKDIYYLKKEMVGDNNV